MNNLKGKFVYAKDLYNYMKFHPDEMNENQRQQLFEHVFNIFDQVAANSPIYEAYYYLGEMFLNGDYVQKNVDKAFRYYVVCSSHSHALSFYKLYTLIKEQKIRKKEVLYTPVEYDDSNLNEPTQDEKTLMLRYLKRSAEEGYVEAQHELANCFMSGIYTKVDLKLALAWHRQACRNGFIASYEPCGDILYQGSGTVRKNRVLSLVMYYTAYSNGLFKLKDKVLKVKDELEKEGEPLPEMILV